MTGAGEILQLGKDMWDCMSFHVHLYRHVLSIERPDPRIAQDPGAIGTDEDDWQIFFHATVDADSFEPVERLVEMVPLRAAVMIDCFNRYRSCAELPMSDVMSAWCRDAYSRFFEKSRVLAFQELLTLEVQGVSYVRTPAMVLLLYLGSAGNLQSLYDLRLSNLNYEPYIDQLADKLPWLPALRDLQLSGSGVKDEQLSIIAHLTELQELNLSNTSVSANGIKQLVNARTLSVSNSVTQW